MRVLVTGSAGFIGSHICHILCSRGDSVVGLDNFNEYYDSRRKRKNTADVLKNFPTNFRVVEGDILDVILLGDLCASEHFDAIIHLAARAGVRASLEDPFLTEKVNIRGTLRVFDAARRFAIPKVIYASSSSVYGDCRDIPFRESQFLRPVSPYAATKLANENDAYIFSSAHGLQTIGFRFFTVYGPRGRPDMAPYLFTDRIARGLPLPKFGDGTTARDYTFIDDIVSGVMSALDHFSEPYGVFNLGNAEVTTLNEFIALIENILGKKAIIQQLPFQQGDVTITNADITLAREKLGFLPKTSLRQGMEKFVEWYAREIFSEKG
ncbi:GDP-mannose 4,6-dehydratase [Candidatus Peregrinibacteria bacterium]|nr:MAG: GDP-mannose 4,6-dehydratase [Candidatus Peregrinibacteria bacterium]